MSREVAPKSVLLAANSSSASKGAVEGRASLAMPSKTPHALQNQHVHATGAPAGGYIISSNGNIDPRDASGALLRKPFNVKRSWRLDEVAEHLEAHIAKHSGELQLSAAQACRPFSMCLACWQICSCACALLSSPPFACALVISGNDDGVAGGSGDGDGDIMRCRRPKHVPVR